ncbi:MmcQ/YjbR family DNA-binding protein [Amycolatopsis suaedae]|uniref:MmcQ/YjbR family DNA-binding protein n=1 Tax=Amycolatopsis suaedae TaxID=2510978 RepID=A0A4Q7J2I8_9PSEU|nr:MmcQ/YjbR family DNA-binding protein [Amycolatopsis suaedae]RZQ61117.1 hypothetical protein EWH70_24835 [Amycolatopsis suaedae]
MPTIDDVRDLSLALPDTTEGTHFRMPSFEVGGKHFAVVQKGKNRVLLYLAESDGRSAIAKDPQAVSESIRRDKWEGVWVDLSSVKAPTLKKLVTLAHKTKSG